MARLIVAPQAQADPDDILDYLTREAASLSPAATVTASAAPSSS
jgi:hypothetical protein